MARIILVLELATLCMVAIGVARTATDWRMVTLLDVLPTVAIPHAPIVYTIGK